MEAAGQSARDLVSGTRSEGTSRWDARTAATILRSRADKSEQGTQQTTTKLGSETCDLRNPAKGPSRPTGTRDLDLPPPPDPSSRNQMGHDTHSKPTGAHRCGRVTRDGKPRGTRRMGRPSSQANRRKPTRAAHNRPSHLHVPWPHRAIDTAAALGVCESWSTSLVASPVVVKQPAELQLHADGMLASVAGSVPPRASRGRVSRRS